MAVFGGMTLTNKGLVLQGKAQAGAQLKYTRIAIGDGVLSGQSIPAMNALISQKKSLSITRLQTQPPNKAVIGASLSNADITTGFYFREVGVFAQDPDAGEILYAYANAGVTADYIAPGGGTDIIEKVFDCIVVVGTASNITATLDDSLVFARESEVTAKFNVSTGHKHTGVAGDGPKITASGLADSSVGTAQLGAKVVTQAKIGDKAVGAGQLMDGAATDTIIGNRTISDAAAPTGDTGTPTTLLGLLANMIKSITGKSSWRTAPATTLEAAKVHADDSIRHITAAERTTWNAKAPLDSPTLTGTPTGPTPAADTSTKQLATAEFVLNQAGTAAPGRDFNNSGLVGTSKKYAREDHLHPATYPNDYKTAAALPSTYPVGSSIFFALNASGNGWPSTYGTIHTIRGYDSGVSAIQYFYPYNVKAPVKCRMAYYPNDVWGNWAEVIDSSGPSTTALVPNLNAEYVGGYGISFSAIANTVAVRNGSGNLTGVQFVSSAPSGSAPFVVASNTMVPGLNTELHGGFKVSELERKAAGTISADLNAGAALVHGKYIYSDSVANSPVAGLWGTLDVTVSDGGTYNGSNWIFQVARVASSSAGTTREFRRSKINNAAWSAWSEYWHADTHNSTGDPHTQYALKSTLADTLTYGGVINMLGDSGRFVGPENDPKDYKCSDAFANSTFFSSWNGTSVADGGKFIYDNSTYGGAAGSLNSDVASLVTAIGGSTRYGPEYHIASYTMGPGTYGPNATVPTAYLMTACSSMPAGGVASRFTVSFWIRLKTGTRVVIDKDFRLRKNGVIQSAPVQLTSADGWMHIENVIGAGSGYSNGAPYIHATAGDVVQIALPVVVLGGVGVGVHKNPVMGASLGFVPLPLSSYTASDVLAKLLTVDGAGSKLDADLLDGHHSGDFLLADGSNSIFLELGANRGSGGVSYIDFHTSGAGDFDARIIADGGNGTGNGTLSLQGGRIVTNTQLWVAQNTAYGASSSLTLPIGDSDTGINWVTDGRLDFYSNGQLPFQLNGDAYFKTTSDGMVSLPHFWNAYRYKPLVSARLSADTPIASNVMTKLLFSTKEGDARGEFSNGTYTAQTNGWYFVSSFVKGLINTNASANLKIFVNNAFHKSLATLAGNGNTLSLNGTAMIWLTAGWALDIRVEVFGGTNLWGSSTDAGYLHITKLAD
ncbi:phage tail-collar fiber domain-containing protein [Paenibacillus riograndensis]|uniref:Phage tail fibre protein N-terminal domain-containing protein n=1 Tax=Paenibacillus riograndensis SBR5 TaxID=1073571 RepID=A0A0E3WJA3_9BACL|nr:phage tail protein [Paenibacillus riograndensis]CQR58438.1 hypothetical protein PRIO_6087 [Paenibacillus riograndensis SBR5]